jgi:hypothetical protein
MRHFEPPGRIAILGAGFAGLGAAEALKRHGIEYDQFDRNPGLGGIWHNGAYAGLHLITPKRTTGYRKFPMPNDYPEFPSGDQVRCYLENFAHQHDLMACLYLGQAATRVQPVDDGTQWRVRFDSGEERLYAGVIAATGHHWLPRYPYVEGSFSGTQFHSSEYRSPTVFRGKRVLVVGGGNSAADIAVAAVHADGVSHISMRHGHWILPKSIGGRPVGEMLKSWMPLWLLRPFVQGLLSISIGDYRQYGLEPPTHRLFEQDPTISTQLLYHLQHSDITPHPGIRRLCGSEVEFVDGSKAEFDLICWATGFHVSLPYLGEEVVEIANDVPQLIAGIFPQRYRNLWVFGIGHAVRPIPRYGVGPMISASAELLAHAILLQLRFEQPLGAVIAKLRPKPPGPFSIGPTEALLLARFMGCVARGLRVRQRRTCKIEAGAVRSPGVKETP